MAAVAMPLPHYHSSSTSQDDAFKVEKSFPVLQQNGGFRVDVAAMFTLQRL